MRWKSSQPALAKPVASDAARLMPAPPRWLLAVPDAVRQLEALDRDRDHQTRIRFPRPPAGPRRRPRTCAEQVEHAQRIAGHASPKTTKLYAGGSCPSILAALPRRRIRQRRTDTTPLLAAEEDRPCCNSHCGGSSAGAVSAALR